MSDETARDIGVVDEAGIDPEHARKVVAKTKAAAEKWRQERGPYEMQWYLNSAMRRGEHYVEWNDKYQRLVSAPTAPTRIRITSNRTQAKLRARRSKFLRARYKPTVSPATNEYRDYLNARMTERALDYYWRSANLERGYLTALLWAEVTGKAFWWFHWDPSAKARIVKQGQTGMEYEEQILGNVLVEPGSPFEVLVKEPGVARLADQPEIIRMTLRDLESYRKRYPKFEDKFVPASDDIEAFRYEKQIAQLSPTGRNSILKDRSGDRPQVLVYEHFFAPTGDKPEGQYRLIVGDQLVKEESLPFGFHTMENPYPVIEFADTPSVGQFWSPALIECLGDVQKQYNLVLSKVAEHARVAAHPKLLVAKQHHLNRNAWTQDGGEVVEYTAHMNVPPPSQIAPPQVSSDLWQIINLLQNEFDTLMQIWPVSEGGAGSTNSGYQAQLLQEAANTVHGPDLRLHELALEDAFIKIRKMMAQFYQVPRLLAIVGPNYLPDAMEFSGQMVDEFADLKMEVGSGMPELKSARQEFVMKLYNSNLIGDPADPATRQRAMSLLELGSAQDAFDFAKLDENQARLENMNVVNQGQIPPAMFWENHQLHYNVHSSWLKSPESSVVNPQIREQMIRHLVTHARYVDINAALQIAMENNLMDIAQQLQQTIQQQQMAAQQQQQGPPQQAPQGAPPQGAVPPPQPTPPPQGAGQPQG